MQTASTTTNLISLPENTQRNHQIRQSTRIEQACALLSRELQRTLDLTEIMSIFIRTVDTLVPFESLSLTRNDDKPMFIHGEQQRFWVSYSLEFGDEKPGQITFSRSRRFEEDELRVLEYSLSCVGYPIRNALTLREALEAAKRDSLTGMGNRKALDESLSNETALAERYGSDLTMVMIDIDHFKYVNDNFGHTAGDGVAVSVAEHLSRLTRKTDEVFRFGGDEFALLLRYTSEKSATILAERLRRAIECAPVRGKDRNLTVTISIGLAGFRPGMTAEQLLDKADSALYRAKKEGRNRICSAS